MHSTLYKQDDPTLVENNAFKLTDYWNSNTFVNNNFADEYWDELLDCQMLVTTDVTDVGGTITNQFIFRIQTRLSVNDIYGNPHKYVFLTTMSPPFPTWDTQLN